MNLDSTIDDFSKGVLEVDFPCVEIRQSVSKDGDFVGPGSLSMSAEGELNLKVHVAFDEPQTMVDLLNGSMSSEAGALVPEDDYLKVVAKDAVASVWECPRVLFSHSVSFPTSSGVFNARPKVIRRTEPTRSATHRLRLYFFGQEMRDWKGLLGGPYTVATTDWSVQLSIAEVSQGKIMVEVTSTADFPEAFERRLIEGLQFVVGQHLHTAIVDEVMSSTRTLSLYSHAKDVRRVPAFPPLAINTSEHTAEHLSMLNCYLAYLSDQPDEGIWSRPSSFLSMLRRASESSIDGWLIGICVAVEGLAGLIELAPSTLSSELIKFQSHVADWVKEEKISEDNRKRIEGLVGQLGAIRAQDRMISLVASGHLIQDDLAVWKKVRNSAVHTRKSGADDLKAEKLQVRIDHLHDVYRLLYSIIFHVIGYSGKFTDYAQHHFPVRAYSYPIPSAPTPA